MEIKCFMSGFQIRYFNPETNRIEIRNTNPEPESVEAFKKKNKDCLVLSVKLIRPQVSAFNTRTTCG
jgi:hypothetical protein